MNERDSPFHHGDIVVIRDSVPTWGGRSGTVERVSFDGSAQVRISPAALLWFDKWELRHHSGAPILTRSDFT
jgi:hypothetical protein